MGHYSNCSWRWSCTCLSCTHIFLKIKFFCPPSQFVGFFRGCPGSRHICRSSSGFLNLPSGAGEEVFASSDIRAAGRRGENKFQLRMRSGRKELFLFSVGLLLLPVAAVALLRSSSEAFSAQTPSSLPSLSPRMHSHGVD